MAGSDAARLRAAAAGAGRVGDISQILLDHFTSPDAATEPDHHDRTGSHRRPPERGSQR